jgi:hypothetical protein
MRARSRLRSDGGGSTDRDATSASTASNNSDIAHLLTRHRIVKRTDRVRVAYLSRTKCAAVDVHQVLSVSRPRGTEVTEVQGKEINAAIAAFCKTA